MFGLIKRKGAYELVEGDSAEAIQASAKAERFEVLLVNDEREKLETKRAALAASKAQVDAARSR